MNKYRMPFLFTFTGLSAIGGFLFGYDTGVIGGANLFIQNDINPYNDSDKELVTSMATLGAAFGALFGGPFADSLGRKPAIYLGDLLFIAGALILAFANSITVLVIGRIIIGLGVGLAAMVVPIYLSQSSPSALRGRIVTINVLFIVLGQALAYAICFALGSNWRLMLGIAAAPAVIQLFGMLFMPESPRWLLKVNKFDKAINSMQRMFNSKNQAALSEMSNQIDQIKEVLMHQGNLGFFEQIKNLFKDYWKGVTVGIMMQVWQQFCGINTALYYGPNIIEDAGFGGGQKGTLQHDRQVLLYSIPLTSINFIFTIVTLFVIDKYGRRFIMLRTLPFISFFMFCLGASFAVINIAQLQWGKWLAISSVCLYLAFFAIGMGSAPWTINAQIYPLPLRATANALATTANWLSNYVVSAVFLSAIKTDIGTVITYGVIGLFCIGAFIFVYFLLPETKGKSLPQIQQFFRSKKRNTQYGGRLSYDEQAGECENDYQQQKLISGRSDINSID